MKIFLPLYIRFQHPYLTLMAMSCGTRLRSSALPARSLARSLTLTPLLPRAPFPLFPFFSRVQKGQTKMAGRVN